VLSNRRMYSIEYISIDLGIIVIIQYILNSE